LSSSKEMHSCRTFSVKNVWNFGLSRSHGIATHGSLHSPRALVLHHMVKRTTAGHMFFILHDTLQLSRLPSTSSVCFPINWWFCCHLESSVEYTIVFVWVVAF
jgi:hypothetical protein